MGLYAISDLHLSNNTDKPMDIFGDKWSEHHLKIKDNWCDKIKDSDTVLISGDISWAMNIEEAMTDLQWISSLPGNKILVRGNHDYWWSSIKKLNSLYDNMNFIQNNFFQYNDYAICGTRGWNLPGGENYALKDEKIYQREIIRLKLSLDDAVKNGFQKFIVMMHFPPLSERIESTGFVEVLKEYNVSKVIFGHLHGSSCESCIDGIYDGIEYILTSCDYLNFDLMKIL